MLCKIKSTTDNSNNINLNKKNITIENNFNANNIEKLENMLLNKSGSLTCRTLTKLPAAHQTAYCCSSSTSTSPAMTENTLSKSKTAIKDNNMANYQQQRSTRETISSIMKSEKKTNKKENSNENENSIISNRNSSSNSKTISNTPRNSSNIRFKNTFSNINNNFNCLIKFAICLIFFTCFDLTDAALRNVNLYIEPPAVRRGQSVTLQCQYTLEGAPLYSVKFYRGHLEFFRYTPGEFPNTKVFPYPGIKVDESISNATQVVIRNVNFNLSGNFSCEVTADAPLFSTATAYSQMQVVEFPDKRPQLFTEHSRYEPGDVLRANCSTQPSRPHAELRFTINNIPVSSEETQYIKTVDNLIASRLSLKVQLQAIHFVTGNTNLHMINALGGRAGNNNNNGGGGGGAGGVGLVIPSYTAGSVGGLLLRCTAQIGDLYQEYKEIELGTPQRDPVPARVTSSGGGFRGFLETYFGPNSAATTNFSTKNLNLFIISTIICLLHSLR